MAAPSILKTEVSDLAYYYLENDTQVSFLGTDKEIQNLQAKIIKTIEEIKDFDFEDFLKSHGKCEFCKNII